MNNCGAVWRKWDLHIHSVVSDGKGNLEQIIDEAEQILVIALTDHPTVDNVDKTKEIGK